MVGWKILSKAAPRVAVASNLFPLEVCAEIVAAVKPFFHDDDGGAAGGGGYQTRPASKCGDKTMALLKDSNMLQAAEEATGIRYRLGEDIMIARTSKQQRPTPSSATTAAGAASFSNVHHDRNNAGSDNRVATFMVYLTTIDRGNGGETFFPALNANVDIDPVAIGLKSAYQSGQRILDLDSSLSMLCEKRLARWRTGERNSFSNVVVVVEGEKEKEKSAASLNGGSSSSSSGSSSSSSSSDSIHDDSGVGIQCESGKAVVFEASSEHGSWHAPCLVVGGQEEKWIITFFKSPPTRFTGMMLGL
tara:strand:- start:100 stop:1011 length:912 start_codon:yes stop_codon:yes gene_type:complete